MYNFSHVIITDRHKLKGISEGMNKKNALSSHISYTNKIISYGYLRARMRITDVNERRHFKNLYAAINWEDEEGRKGTTGRVHPVPLHPKQTEAHLYT